MRVSLILQRERGKVNRKLFGYMLQHLVYRPGPGLLGVAAHYGGAEHLACAVNEYRSGYGVYLAHKRINHAVAEEQVGVVRLGALYYIDRGLALVAVCAAGVAYYADHLEVLVGVFP